MSPFEVTSASLIQVAVESLASAPHFTAAQKRTRSEAVICAIMAFLPTEPVQTMLASQAVGHHFTLLDTFQEIIVRALPETISMRMRMVTVAQTRSMLTLVRELRVVRKESVAAAVAEQNAMQAAGTVRPGQTPPPPAADDTQFETNMRVFEEAVTATAATLEEARTLDKSTAKAAMRSLEKAFAPTRAASNGRDIKDSAAD